MISDNIYVIIGVSILNIASAIYASKNDSLTWGFSLLSSLCMAIVFIADDLYISALYMAYCFFLSLFASIVWDDKATENEKKLTKQHFLKHQFINLIIIIISLCLNELFFNSVMNPLDIIACSFAIIATYELVYSNVYSWINWIISDILYIILGIYLHNNIYISTYLLLLLIAIYSYYKNSMLYNIYNK